MEQAQVGNGHTEPNIFWLIIKIAFVILIVILGIKYFSEKHQSGEEERFVERKKTKSKKIVKKDE